MSAGKHTKGPWRVEVGTALVWGACNSDDPSSYGLGYPIAECRVTPSGLWASGPDADEGEANAALIARAVNRDALFGELVSALKMSSARLWSKGENGLAREIDVLLDRATADGGTDA